MHIKLCSKRNVIQESTVNNITSTYLRADNLMDKNNTEIDEHSNANAPCADNSNAKQGHKKIAVVTHNVTNDNLVKTNA